MDLEIIEEEKGVGIADNHNFHGSVYGDRCMGQRDECIQENQGLISVPPGTGNTLSGTQWQVLVFSVQEQWLNIWQIWRKATRETARE